MLNVFYEKKRYRILQAIVSEIVQIKIEIFEYNLQRPINTKRNALQKYYFASDVE